MPRLKFLRESSIERSPRVIQLEGLFELPPSPTTTLEWDVNIPIDTFDWNIGVIVGPSGCGKSTLAQELFPHALSSSYHWDTDRSIVDNFPKSLSIKEITSLLSSVGFCSPPSWLRPFHVLSNGEQFRVNIARGLAEHPDILCFDEFTSVVDRQIAKIGSAAIAKAVRRRKQQFVAISCHYDILEWLQPDWVWDPSTARFARDCLQRPQIPLAIKPVHRNLWDTFSKYHYLSHNIHKGAKCFAAFYNNRPVAFTAVLHLMHPTGTMWKEHRTVCLPDFQGVGIGNSLSNYVASAFHGYLGRNYTSVTANPAMVAYRAKSSLWKMTRKPKINPNARARGKKPGKNGANVLRRSFTTDRLTASFKYVGPKNPDALSSLGLI